jgi:glutathione S-transferase
MPRPEYRAMNPNVTVPMADDNGYVLWASNAIVQYLVMRYDPELLYGNDTKIFASAGSCRKITN